MTLFKLRNALRRNLLGEVRILHLKGPRFATKLRDLPPMNFIQSRAVGSMYSQNRDAGVARTFYIGATGIQIRGRCYDFCMGTLSYVAAGILGYL